MDSVQFVCPKTYQYYNKETNSYDTFDMSEFDLVMEYKLPISHVTRVITLELVDDNYKNEFLSYMLPSGTLTTALTAETGDVEMALFFTKAELDYDGNTVERVRPLVNPVTLKILPLTSWFHPTDQQISDIAAMYLENKKIALANAEIMNQLNTTKADGIQVNDGSLDLTCNGEAIASVPLEELNEKLVSVGGETTGNVTIIQI
jgi:hypothetical protein